MTAKMAIHPTAIVEDGAALGAGVEIGPFCIVGRDVRLGDGVRLISHVVIAGITTIGPRCVIHPNSVLGGESQIRGHDPKGTRLVIGEDTVIRESVTISLGSSKGHGVTEVGARGFFMALSHIGHDCRVGNDVTFANGVQLAGHVDIADGVIIGGLSAVQQFGRIGRGAMLGLPRFARHPAGEGSRIAGVQNEPAVHLREVPQQHESYQGIPDRNSAGRVAIHGQHPRQRAVDDGPDCRAVVR